MHHVFVTAEARALHGALRGDHLGELIGIELMADAIPEEFLAVEYQAIDVTDMYTSPQFP